MTEDPELRKAWEEVQRLNADPATQALAQAREVSLVSYVTEIAAATRKGEAGAVVRVLEVRQVAVSDEQRARILECRDLELLAKWLGRAVTAERADDVFAD